MGAARRRCNPRDAPVTPCGMILPCVYMTLRAVSMTLKLVQRRRCLARAVQTWTAPDSAGLSCEGRQVWQRP